MPLKLMQHPKGPALPNEAKRRYWRSYVDLANWADDNLSFGLYYVRNANAANLAAIREITFEEGLFHVERYGNV